MKRGPAAAATVAAAAGTRGRRYAIMFAMFVAVNIAIVLLFHVLTHRSGGSSPMDHPTFVRSGVVPKKAAAAAEIPRTIHMTWKTAELPLWGRYSVDSWTRMNPGYKWVLHTDDEMDAYMRARQSEAVVAVWDKLKPIQKADFYRYIIVLDEGGVYADLDVTCVRKVDEWAASVREFAAGVGLIVGFEAIVDQDQVDKRYFARRFQLVQWVFAGVAGHPVLRSVVDMIVAMLTPMTREEIHNASVIRTTGPVGTEVVGVRG
jgi:mannosyltransferase OCH1-like enzyme